MTIGKTTLPLLLKSQGIQNKMTPTANIIVKTQDTQSQVPERQLLQISASNSQNSANQPPIIPNAPKVINTRYSMVSPVVASKSEVDIKPSANTIHTTAPKPVTVTS